MTYFGVLLLYLSTDIEFTVILKKLGNHVNITSLSQSVSP